MTSLPLERTPALEHASLRHPLVDRERLWGLIFLSPWIVGFLVFTALPMAASLVFSFSSFDLLHLDQGLRFAGLQNWIRLFHDPQVAASLLISVRFALISVPLSIALPLGLALLVNSPRLIGKTLFRTLFYMPYMIPVVATVLVWGGVLNGDSGWLNRFLSWAFGLEGPQWFTDGRWVLVTLSIMGFWGVGNAMLTLLAGLQNVPTDLYEAAKVDGAGPLRSFALITLPMISPVIFYNLTLAIIGAFQYFTQAYIISNGRGDPDGATLFFNLYLYKTAFAFLDMPYGATLAWLMFIIVLALTILLFATASRWVFYAGGED
jgi:ABC-type sugar transport system permease subunit